MSFSESFNKQSDNTSFKITYLKWVNECVKIGIFVKSFSDKSNSRRADIFGANSCGIDGNSLCAISRTRSTRNGSSGTALSDTFVIPNLIRRFNPTNDLSRIFNSSLCDKFNSYKLGKVANAASSKRNSRL